MEEVSNIVPAALREYAKGRLSWRKAAAALSLDSFEELEAELEKFGLERHVYRVPEAQQESVRVLSEYFTKGIKEGLDE